MIVLGMLIVWILRIASEAIPISTTVIGPVALWIALLFSGLLAQERSFAIEQQQDCIYGLLLAPVDAGTIYLAKLFVNVVMAQFVHYFVLSLYLLLQSAICVASSRSGT